jgi:hypothetical protein
MQWIILTVIDGWNSPTKHFGFNVTPWTFNNGHALTGTTKHETLAKLEKWS